MTASDPAYVMRRAALIAEAEAILQRSPTASGVTLFIPKPDGSLEELYVAKPRKHPGRERAS